MQIRREIRMWSDWGREFFPELKQETLREIERCGGVWPFLRSLRLEMRSHGGVINYMRGCVNDAIACRNFHVSMARIRSTPNRIGETHTM